MAEPIIFTLLLGDKDQILEKTRNQEVPHTPNIISLQTNKESQIPNKDRIFSEILVASKEQNKSPIFNVQLNDNSVTPIFQIKDLVNLQNLNIKSTITFDHYDSLANNPKLTAYWKQLFTEVNHVFFVNEQDRELAVNEGIISREKTTTIKDIDSILSVFNSLTDDQKFNKLFSDVIPDKAKLDKIITTTKNQGGRVIIKTWPLSLDEVTNLITSKFGITSEDQIYGLKLEINEILKDQNNAAENLEKYVSQISKQFRKDLGKSEVNPIDFRFDKEKLMKAMPDNIQKEQTIYESIGENQQKPQGFFKNVLNDFKDKVSNFKETIFGKKEKIQAPKALNQTESKKYHNKLLPL